MPNPLTPAEARAIVERIRGYCLLSEWDDLDRLAASLDAAADQPVDENVEDLADAVREGIYGDDRMTSLDVETALAALRKLERLAAPPPAAVTQDTERLPVPESLNERRAWFVYEAARLAAAAALAPIVPEEWHGREAAFRTQFLDVIARQVGPYRSASPSDLHADWVRAYEAMGWQYGPERDRDAKTHPDMVPYDELGQLERDKDAVFVALCEIARQWIYDAAPPTPEGT